MKLLIVEDERRLADTLVEIARKAGYEPHAVYDGETGLEEAQSGIYDLILLDVMLPRMDGFSVLRELRGGGDSTPVILLTARRDTGDRVAGLDCGADYYLTKPFETQELLACMRAVTRRGGEVVMDVLRFGDLALNLSAAELSCGTQRLSLRKKELDIMRQLMMQKGAVVSKETLLVKVWGYDSDAEYNNVEVYISFLRKKLTFLGSRVSIVAMRNLGYRLEETV